REWGACTNEGLSEEITVLTPYAFLSVLLSVPAMAQSIPEGSSVPAGLSTSDWSGIRAEYDAGRHAAVPVEGVLQAWNPEQRWTTLFDGSGFVVTPEAGGWSWGLALTGWRRPGAEPVAATSSAPRADGGRVERD